MTVETLEDGRGQLVGWFDDDHYGRMAAIRLDDGSITYEPEDLVKEVAP